MKTGLLIIRSIAINTYRETIRDKLLYSLIGFAALVIAASLLAGSVSLGQDIRVIESFGLTAILLFTLVIIIFIGTQLVRREVEQKTIYFTLSKPISRAEFYLGKFAGLCLTVITSIFIMAVVLAGLLDIRGQSLSSAFVWAVTLMMMEACLLVALSLLFSALSAPLTAAVYTFGLFLIGHSSTIIHSLADKSTAPLKIILNIIYYLLPNLEKFNLRNEVIYSIAPVARQIGSVAGYFVAYTALLLILGILVINKDEF